MNWAIVTSAGASSRMGSPKALLNWRGQPLVAHQVNLLVEAGFSVVVVLGHEHERVRQAVPEQAQVVVNERWSTGRSSSIRAGAQAVGEVSRLLVVAVDQPLFSEVLKGLLAVEGPLVQAVRGGGLLEHPVLFSGDVVGELCGLTGSLREVVEARAGQRMEVVFPDRCFVHLNCVEDYLEAKGGGIFEVSVADVGLR